MIPVHSASTLKEIDQFTIEKEISAEDLMERAGVQFTQQLLQDFEFSSAIIICGPGNNGGDGFVIARALSDLGKSVVCYLSKDSGSPEFNHHLKLIPDNVKLKKVEEFGDESEADVLIDAVFGYGLNRPVEGKYAQLVQKVNRFQNPIISVDIPSGMPAEPAFELNLANCVASDLCYTFHSPKLNILLPSSKNLCENFKILDIGLLDQKSANKWFLGFEDAQSMVPQPSRFTYKHKQGSVLCVGGNEGTTGAICLSGEAVLNTGAGLLYMLIPECAVHQIQSRVPEAMYLTSGTSALEELPKLPELNAIAVGPGMGQSIKQWDLLQSLMKTGVPMVIDAAALRLISEHKGQDQIPLGSILTPHEGEFKALAGSWETEAEKLNLLQDFSKKYHCVVVLKGAYTIICHKETMYFNSSGIPQLATAGSGDVLTGIISSYLAQGCNTLDSAILGVYTHGLAAQVRLMNYENGTIIASGIIESLPEAISILRS
ncbi:NAD(P)H-hydrate dehydratase [bacterium]|nr:NAD(P)H-hydrate dehydratase [bacterium]